MCVADMSIRYMRFIADLNWKDLTDKERKIYKSMPKRQLGHFCKYGYTQHSLWLADDGKLIYCKGYCEYCDIMHHE